ncbi:MAG: glycosyltransferase family 4 protein [Chloroflexi bacterium]|nr:glycosyltransferase family 4 protein [Chloroflexota bacterium]
MNANGPNGPRVAYIMSRFPRLTETFILYEILALERRGLRVEIYPLLRERRTRVHPDGASTFAKAIDLMSDEEGELVMHAEARELLPRVHYGGLLGWAILRDVGSALVRRPIAFLATLATVVRCNLGSPNHLLGGLAIFPRAVHIGAEMRRAGITHVHAHFANHPTTAAFVIRALSGIDYSFTGHGADLQVDQHMLREKIGSAAFARAISADGRQFMERLAPEGAAARVVVVPCGIDTASFEGPRQARGPGSPLRLLCVATMYEVKGHRYLFEAMSLLTERGIDAVCWLAGDGPDRAALEADVARRGMDDRIRFLGRQTRDQVIKLMHEADLLVVPSVPTASGRREGLPVVIMEAMAARLPVVASAISGIPEIVHDQRTGLAVPPRDGAAIADAVRRLATDEAMRASMVENAARLVRETYDLDVVSARLVELFAAGRAPGTT